MITFELVAALTTGVIVLFAIWATVEFFVQRIRDRRLAAMAAKDKAGRKAGA